MRRLLALAIVVSTIAGCASIENPGKKIPEINSAPLHSYSLGDTFVFSDGYTETVIATSPTEVTWALGPSPTTAVRSVNFFDPTIKWKWDGMSYRFEKSSRTGALWPMREGLEQSLAGQLIVDHRNGSQSFDQQWTCRVTHSERLQLKVDSFDTFVVDCKRQSESGAHWQRRRFNYDPTLGHYVRVVDEMKAHGYPGYVFKQRDLVYFRTGSSENYTSAFQKALSTLSSGEVFTYESNGAAYKAELKTSSMSEAGVLCRSIDVQDEQSANYSAEYCLTDSIWTLIRMHQPKAN